MAKFTLNPAPTFKAKVDIPVPGGKVEKVEFTFRHRTREEFQRWLEDIDGKDGHVVVLEAASGWELEEPFDEEHVKELLSNYIGSLPAVMETYIRELSGQREKN